MSPIPVTDPTPAPDAAEKQPIEPPFWLRLNGEWVALKGIESGARIAPDRPRSAFVSVDGYRHEQQAPRVSRAWELDIAFASPAAVAALQVAAEGGEVWLSDRSATVANMLDPRDTHSQVATDPVLMCGGVPLRAWTTARTITHPIRLGTMLTLGVWTDAPAGTVVASLSGDVGAPVDVVADGPAGVPHQVTATVAAVASGEVTIMVPATGYRTSGLQLVEDATPSEAFQVGQRMPCRVVVDDPDRALLFLRGRVGYGAWSMVLREVSS